MATEKTAPSATTPSEADLLAAGDIEIFDESGKAVPFKSLYPDDGSRHLIVFIRHYFCSHCEYYTTELSQRLPQSKLDTLSPPVKLSIIGCGQVTAVADYKKRTGCGFPIYSNPDQKLYKKLGMVISLAMGDKSPDYIKTSFLTGVLHSLASALSSPSKTFKGGDFAQNGGELLFEHGKLTWIHKMQNTRDHAEIAEVEKVLGI